MLLRLRFRMEIAEEISPVGPFFSKVIRGRRREYEDRLSRDV